MLGLYMEHINRQDVQLKMAIVEVGNMPFEMTIIIVEDDIQEQLYGWE